ncbi:alpha/beta fold hydrolase [Flavobacterium sedimenticola]|uniref:Alpha/beta hydrolase n=1 Tax=Flavobacterium sedimenticola TaxID=3043286 RepID=A0ABT6XSS7_9FLAO|nr:alpha/beta hydrolase [Flavobacterium sedimenticola]MDI9258161.1 alpha/beta hydrolase [Flavobacterium sedimenticola]
MKKTIVAVGQRLLWGVLLLGAAACHNEDENTVPVQEEWVTVQDYELYTRTIGTATPQVVLITGIGGSTDDFKSIEQRLGRFCTVINYDREGLGRSAWQNKPKDSETIARELNALLVQKHITAPFILVAHSIGGLHARTFLALYPEKVSGLVLIDPTPEDLTDTLIGQLPPEYQQPARDAMQQEFNQLLASLPEGGVKEEYKAIEECYTQARALTNSTAVPVQIISSMKVTDGASEASIATAKQLRDALLNELCTGAQKHTLTYNSGHFIQKEAPQLVVDAIHWVLNNQ